MADGKDSETPTEDEESGEEDGEEIINSIGSSDEDMMIEDLVNKNIRQRAVRSPWTWRSAGSDDVICSADIKWWPTLRSFWKSLNFSTADVRECEQQFGLWAGLMGMGKGNELILS